MQRGDVFPYPRVFRRSGEDSDQWAVSPRKGYPSFPDSVLTVGAPPGLGSCVLDKALALPLGPPKESG